MAAETQNIHKNKHKEHKTQHRHTMKKVLKRNKKYKLITTKNL